MRLLITGTSTRAAAASAARAGFAVTGLDAFADIDQHPAVRALSMARDFARRATPHVMTRAASGIDADAVVYLSPFENYPDLVATLARGRRLLGNPPEILRRVRDPLVVYEELTRRGFVVPRVWPRAAAGAEAPAYEVGAPAYEVGAPAYEVEVPARVLSKPLASGGGRGVRIWNPGSRIPATSYLQEYIEGLPGSVTFVAADGHSVVLGVSRQLIGDPAFGARGHRYCGSITAATGDGGFGDDERLLAGAQALAEAVSETFGLVGVNGIDFIARHREPVAIEINPRWSASMELAEAACDVSVMAAHVDACATGSLPASHRSTAAGVTGKAIVFARRDVIVGDTHSWADEGLVRDVPRQGQPIRRGEPVCTVLAAADGFDACYARLVQRASAIYDRLAPDEPRIQATASPVD